MGRCMQVLDRLLSMEGGVSGAILPGIMAAIVQALQRHKHACALNVISSAIEAFFRDPSQQKAIQDAFSQACMAVAPLLQVRIKTYASQTKYVEPSNLPVHLTCGLTYIRWVSHCIIDKIIPSRCTPCAGYTGCISARSERGHV